MTGYHVWWIVSLLVLLSIAAWLGSTVGRGRLGILIDTRERYSLTHFQVVLWTVVILSSVLGVFISHGFDPATVHLSSQLLGLIGISAGSGVLASAVKATKDAPGSTARVARAGNLALRNGAAIAIAPRLAQMWLEEEGDQADKVVSITKYQNFVFTLVVLGVYIAMAWKQAEIPTLPDNIVWLIGISHAGYVGGKVPNKM